MNPGHRAWADPFKGGVSNEGFVEVFERALDDYAGLVERLETDDDLGVERACHLDYGGRPLA